MSIQVRGTRDGLGYLVSGRLKHDSQAFQVRIFVYHLSTALAIQAIYNNPRFTTSQRDRLIDVLILSEKGEE